MLKYKLLPSDLQCIADVSSLSSPPSCFPWGLYLLVLFHWFFGKYAQICLTKRGNKKQKQPPLHLLLDPKSGFSPHYSTKTSPKRSVTSLALKPVDTYRFLIILTYGWHFISYDHSALLFEVLYYNGFHDIVLFWFPSSAMLFQSHVVPPTSHPLPLLK